jgi:hypothetical protein
MDDVGEFWGFGRQSGAEAFELLVRPAEQVGEEVRRDVEGHGGGSDAMLP